MGQNNDSTRWIRMAPEISFGAAPAYTITSTGTSGTFILTWNGLPTGTIAYNATPGAVQTALEALTGMGAGNCPCTGTLAAGMTVTPAGWRGAAALTANFAGITGGTSTLTNGPVWTLLKVSKANHLNKPNIEVLKSIRNSPDMQYQDSVAAGGSIEEWDWAGALRPDQFPLYASLCGMDDVATTHAGETVVYDHTQKPGTGKTYSIEMYDGQVTWLTMGLTGTDLNIKTAAGEQGKYEFDLKGFGKKAVQIFQPTITLPSNLTYRMLKSTNAGVLVTWNGSTSNLLIEGAFNWKRGAKPLYSQTGTVDPYRVEIDERLLELQLKMIFDDVTEVTQAMATPPPSRTLVLNMAGVEAIGSVPSVPAIQINVPRLVYTEPKVDNTGASTKVDLKASVLYDTATAGAWSIVTTNQQAAAY